MSKLRNLFCQQKAKGASSSWRKNIWIFFFNLLDHPRAVKNKVLIRIVLSVLVLILKWTNCSELLFYQHKLLNKVVFSSVVCLRICLTGTYPALVFDWLASESEMSTYSSLIGQLIRYQYSSLIGWRENQLAELACDWSAWESGISTRLWLVGVGHNMHLFDWLSPLTHALTLCVYFRREGSLLASRTVPSLVDKDDTKNGSSSFGKKVNRRHKLVTDMPSPQVIIGDPAVGCSLDQTLIVA